MLTKKPLGTKPGIKKPTLGTKPTLGAKKPMSGLKKKIIGGAAAAAVAAGGTAVTGKLTGRGPLGGLGRPATVQTGGGMPQNVNLSNTMSYQGGNDTDDNSVKDNHSVTKGDTVGDTTNTKTIGGDDNSKKVGNITTQGNVSF